MELKSGETYAVDFTGPQHGHFGNPVLPWEAYERMRIKSIKKQESFGSTLKHLKKLCYTSLQKHERALWRIHTHLARQLLKGTKAWELGHISMKELLGKPENYFQEYGAQYLADVKHQLRMHKATLLAKGADFHKDLLPDIHFANPEEKRLLEETLQHRERMDEIISMFTKSSS